MYPPVTFWEKGFVPIQFFNFSLPSQIAGLSCYEVWCSQHLSLSLFLIYLRALSVLRLYSANHMDDTECGAVGGMRNGKGILSTQR
jgi:hypothetical protein